MEPTDQELLDKAKSGDNDALAQLLRRRSPQIRRGLHINPKWRSVLELDDVLQITYLEAFLEIARFTSDAKAFPTWLRRIAENNLRDAIDALERAKRPQPENRLTAPEGQDSILWLYQLATATGTTPTGKVAREEIRQILETEIEMLPADYGSVLRLLFFEEKSISETADAMNRTKGATFLLRIRALDRPKDRLGTGSRFFSH